MLRLGAGQSLLEGVKRGGMFFSPAERGIFFHQLSEGKRSGAVIGYISGVVIGENQEGSYF